MFIGPVHVTGFYTLDQPGPFILLFKKKKIQKMSKIKGKYFLFSYSGILEMTLISFM